MTCCCPSFCTEIHNGFVFCVGCGRMVRRHLSTNETSFSQKTHFMPRGYSRRSRFVKKVLGSLRLQTTHEIDSDLMNFLKKQKVETPQDLLQKMSEWKTKSRRPYSHAMQYWRALEKPVPHCTDEDVTLLVRTFDEILFAWERLRIKNPRFPYSWLFTRLVSSDPRYSAGMRALVPFLRKLRCKKRNARYEELFQKCKNFDYLNIYEQVHIKEEMNEEKIDENEIVVDEQEIDEYPEQIVTREVIRNPKSISPYDVKGKYKSDAEMKQALANGNFQIEKCFHTDNHGNFYILGFMEKAKPDPSQVSDMQLHDSQQVEYDETQELNKMLAAQSLL